MSVGDKISHRVCFVKEIDIVVVDRVERHIQYLRIEPRVAGRVVACHVNIPLAYTLVGLCGKKERHSVRHQERVSLLCKPVHLWRQCIEWRPVVQETFLFADKVSSARLVFDDHEASVFALVAVGEVVVYNGKPPLFV